MLGSITYFIRQHCRWTKVTTSVSEWLRIPHVSIGGACQAGALMLGGLTGASTPVMPIMPAPAVAWAPTAAGDTAPSGFDMRPGDVPYILSPDSLSPDFLSPGMLSGQPTGAGSVAAATPVASSSGDLCCSGSSVAPTSTPTDLLLPTVVLPSDSIRPPATITPPAGGPTGGSTIRETSIPEPAPVAVVGLGLLAALGSRRYLSRRKPARPT